MKKCKSCGNFVEDSARFCNECGYKFEDVSEVKQETVVEVKDEDIVKDDIFAKTETIFNEEVKDESKEESKEESKIVECPVCGAIVNKEENPNCPVCGALLNDAKPKAEATPEVKQNARKSGLATASFIIGIVCCALSMTFAMYGATYIVAIGSIVAIVFGIISLCKKVRGKALVFSIIGIALAAYGLLIAMAFPLFEEIIEEIEDELYQYEYEFSYGLFIKFLK